LARQAHQLSRQGAFLLTEPLRALVACDEAALPGLLRALGYRQTGRGPEMTFQRKVRSPARKIAQDKIPSSPLAGDGLHPVAANEDRPPPALHSAKPADAGKKPARRRRKQGAGAVDPHSPFAALSSLRRRLRAGR
jgi:hypothetical protein